MEKALKLCSGISRANIQNMFTYPIFLQRLDLDVLVLLETWLREDITDNFVSVCNYSMYRQDRSSLTAFNTTKRGGGIIMYVKNSIQFSLMDSNIFCNNTEDLESCCIKLSMPHLRPVYIMAIYRPPSGSIPNFKTALFKLMENMPVTNKNYDVFIGGDYNIDYSTNNPNKKTLKEFERRYGLVQLIHDSTRPLYGKSTIDLIFTNNEALCSSGTCNINISDHVPIYVRRKKVRAKPIKSKFIGRTYKKYNSQTFQNHLRETDWNYYYGIQNPNEAWDFLYGQIEQLVDRMCPLVKSKYKNSRPAWITRELMELAVNRDKAMSLAKRRPIEINILNARHLRNSTKTAFKKAKSDYITLKLEEHRDCPKKFWQDIEMVIPNQISNS